MRTVDVNDGVNYVAQLCQGSRNNAVATTDLNEVILLGQGALNRCWWLYFKNVIKILQIFIKPEQSSEDALQDAIYPPLKSPDCHRDYATLFEILTMQTTPFDVEASVQNILLETSALMLETCLSRQSPERRIFRIELLRWNNLK